MKHAEIIALAKEEGLSFIPEENSHLARIVRKAVENERSAFERICLEIAAENEGIMRANSHKSDQDDEAAFDNAFEMATAARILAVSVTGRRRSEQKQ